jgi:IclR family mhp operon transcriptional activator
LRVASFDPVTAVLRALDVLMAVNRLKEASVADVFRQTGLNRPTIVRMLETLVHAGFVMRHPTRAVYMPTGKTLELSSGYALHRQVGMIVTPVLEKLRGKIGWPSDVGVFDGDAMVVAETSRGDGHLSFNRRSGYRAPVLATSLGLAFLAFCGEADRARALKLARTSPEPWNGPARSASAAAKLLKTIRRRGFATMHEEYSKRAYRGVASAMGVPILVDRVAVASLNMTFLRDAFTPAEAAAKFLRPLQDAALEIANTIGSASNGTSAIMVSLSSRAPREDG